MVLVTFPSLETIPNFPELHVSFAQKIGSGQSPIQTYFQKPSARGANHRRESPFQACFSALIGCQSVVLSSTTHQAHETQLRADQI